MAVMWPRTLPTSVLQDGRRAAECEVYRKLEVSLGPEWSVFYSRPWWGITRTGAEVDGESDFVVAHPEHGVLFIEVKGGLVAHDPKEGRWSSTDRNGIQHTIKDPVQQAVSSKHRLLEKFRALAGWPSQRVRLRHGVVFPHCEPKGKQTLGSYDPQIFCCCTEFRDGFRNWVESRLASHVEAGADSEIGPGRGGLGAIERALAAPVRLTVPLHRQLQDDVTSQELLLTGAQLAVVYGVECFPRVVIEGGAGTGKTVVAAELACRYGLAGRRTLLCCTSKALVALLRERVGNVPQLDIATIAAVEEVVAQGQLKPYDAVIVDEGQDVAWEQWDTLDRCVHQQAGVLRVMFDSNQAVYRARDDIETRLSAKCFPLRVNLRNTRCIARVTEGLYRGPLITAAGPEGQPLVVLHSTADTSVPKATEVVIRLLRDEGIEPGDIAVLCATAQIAGKMKGKLLTDRIGVSDSLTRAPQSVVVDTIASFKGLEAVVTVMVVDHVSANNSELCYVGASRARALLVVCGPLEGTALGRSLAAAAENRAVPSAGSGTNS